MDYVVEKRKKEFIDEITSQIREKYGFTEPYLDIFGLLDKMMADKELAYHVLSDEEWTNKYPRLEAFSRGREIFFPESLLILVEDSDRTRSRFTLAHELGHVILHIEETQDEKFDYEEHFLVNSSEWQANYFAGSLLAPNEYVLQCNTHQELIDMCRISWQASDVRFKQVYKVL